jgi:ribosome biogenesis GTPase
VVSLYSALIPYGWTERVLALLNELDEPGLQPARIVRVERSACVAVLADGKERTLHFSALPAVGDWVAVRDAELVTVLPRWSELSRSDTTNDSTQILAANIDLVMITAPADRPSVSRVERELALAWDSGAQPVVIMTKADLAPPGLQDSFRQRLAGVDMLAAAALNGQGVEEIRDRLRPNRTAVLLGPSGAGKSSLANAVLGTDRFVTGDVRTGDSRGRHTTTSRQLITVPGGGVLIDTPGLRSLGLSASVDVDAVYPDIESLAARCRFRDCRHEAEPGCAVTAAAAEGSLDHGRLASFRKLQREVAAEERRVDPLVRKEELAKWRARSKFARANDKRKPR